MNTVQAKNILIIASRTSGSQQPGYQEAIDLLNEAKVAFSLQLISKPQEVDSVIATQAMKSFTAVALYGGDGTIAAGIKALKDTDIPILILPGGTANILAAYFGVPGTVRESMHMWLRRTYVIQRAEIAQVGDEPLVLDMHMGFWTETIRRTPRSLKRRYGRAAYAWSAFKQLRAAQKETYTFSINNRPDVTVPAYSCIIANQGRHSILGVPLFTSYEAPGKVQMALIKDVRFFSLLAWFLARMSGKRLPSVIETHRAQRVTLTQSPGRTLSDDSERRIELPAVITAAQYNCRLILPPAPSRIGRAAKIGRRVRMVRYRTMERWRVHLHMVPGERFSLVAPNLYLGGRYPTRAYKLFREWGITGVVSMRRTMSSAPPDIELLRLPTPDWHPPVLDDLERGVEFMRRHIANGGAVYVHCHLGQGRGPTMAAAYLISEGYTVEEALAELRKYRPSVRPNAAQRKRLAEWQQRYNTAHSKQ